LVYDGGKKTFWDGRLQQLQHLKTLSLRLNNLSEFPQEILNLPNIENIDLSSNPKTIIETLPDMSTMVNLKTISFAYGQTTEKVVLERFEPDNPNNYVNTVSENIGTAISLENLDLQTAHIRHLPESIGNLKNLKVLNLGVNQLTELPESIGNLSNLEELSLNHNYTLKLPDSIGNIHNLKKLDLNHSYIKELPDSFSQLEKLENLNLNGCFLTTFPKNISKLKSLKEIDLGGNDFINDDYVLSDNNLWEGLSQMSQLEVLKIGNTRLNIKNMYQKLFDSDVKLPNLKYLDLSEVESTNMSFEEISTLIKEKLPNCDIVGEDFDWDIGEEIPDDDEDNDDDDLDDYEREELEKEEELNKNLDEYADGLNQ